MPGPNPRKSAFSSVLSSPRPWRQSLAIAVAFFIQAALCTIILWYAFTYFHAAGAGWAVVSSFLVLQPEFSQSLSIALTRVSANIIGATVGLSAGIAFGKSLSTLIFSLLLVSILCTFFRLDLALRTACVAIIIVMNADPEYIAATGRERFTAVTIGCLLALVIQFVTQPLTSRLIPRESSPSQPLADG